MNPFKLISLVGIIFNLLSVSAQAPCNTAFTGYDPCSAEPLTLGNDCSNEEVIRTNGCGGTNPSTSSCGLAAGSEIVWTTFLITDTDDVTITWLSSNNRNIRFGLYQFTNACLSTGEVELDCVNDNGNGGDETLTINLTPGQYWICGESSGNLSNTSTMCVSSPSAPIPVVASDCVDGVNICTEDNFIIDPNGAGSNTSEIPPSGDIGNPLYDTFGINSPWGGPNHDGCLLSDETNSTWMFINVLIGGSLEFSFGANGAQAGYYDWIMYPANVGCGTTTTTAPIRCNWNISDNGGTGIGTVPTGGDAGNFEPAITTTSGDVYIVCFSNYSSVLSLVPLNFGGTAQVSCSILPVELANFNASLYNTKLVNVDWITQSEQNNDHFVIERSTNGIDYLNISEIDGAGNSSGQINYNFKDHTPIEGTVNYYRLKQVDFDGTTAYSQVKKVKVPLSTSIVIYPNPSNGNFTIKLKENLNTKTSYSLIIYNTFGIIIDTKTISNNTTGVEFKLNSTIPPGLYHVNLKNTEGSIVFNESILIKK